MTLSQFKNDIKIGTKIECIGFYWTENDNGIGVPEKMRGIRTVDTKNTVGFTLLKDGEKTHSYFEYPKSSELEYDGVKITVKPQDSNGKVFQVREYRIVV